MSASTRAAGGGRGGLEVPRPAGRVTGSTVLLTGLNSQTLRAATLVGRLDAAAQAGFRVVELTGDELDPFLTTPEHAAEHLAARGLRLVGVCPAPDLFDWHHAWDAERAAVLRARLGLYVRLGAGYLVLPFMSDDGDADSARRGLAGAAAVAEEVGMGLAVESIGHVPKLRRLEEVRALLEAVGSPRTGVALDAFHFFRAGHDLADLDALDGLTVHVVQVSNAADKPLDELVGYRDRTFPLDGRFDVLGLCREVARQQAGVPVVVEVMGEVPWALDPVTAARSAASHVRRLAGELDGSDDA